MYTYLIGWSAHNKYYYGVRYAKSRRHMNNGIKGKMALPEEAEILLQQGWQYGRLGG